MIPKWNTACPDWEKRVLNGESLITFPPIFPEEADAALDILGELVLVDVLGKPTMREASRQWVNDFVSAIFGAYDPESGKRLITEFFLLISKKNGKSTDAAAIMLTALIRNWRESAEFLILAPTVEIASNSFSPASDMVKADPELSDLMQVQHHLRTITHRVTGSTLKVVAADNETVGGKKATGILIDEAWLFGKRNNAENMLREACGGLASRPEGFVIWLSTQSDETPAGVFKQKLDYARGVRDGKINDPQFLPVIYEFPKKYIDEKKHLDPEYFYVTNPNLGASVSESFLRRELKKAENDGHESMQGFLAKHLNVEMGMSLKAQRWTGADFWEKAGEDITLDTILDVSDVVVIGVDGGGLDDLLGVAVVGRHAETRDWLLWIKAWLHPIAMERRKSEKSKYMDFAKDGDLVIVDRVGQDMKEFGDLVMYCESSGLLDRIGFDPYCIGDIVAEIESRDFPKINPKSEKHDRLMHVPQGWRLSGAIKTTERRLAGTDESGKRMIHANQPLMTWCVGNARCEVKGNNLYITKQASGTAKIDPLMAAFDAVSLMALNPAPRYGQVSDNYESVI
jgi:phage terminase large subunit-like protein